ncbi:MAG: hypothetical protein ACTSUN_00540 [Promethearchaeota archaeon]
MGPKTIFDTNPINHRGIFTKFLKKRDSSLRSSFTTFFCKIDPRLAKNLPEWQKEFLIHV